MALRAYLFLRYVSSEGGSRLKKGTHISMYDNLSVLLQQHSILQLVATRPLSFFLKSR